MTTDYAAQMHQNEYLAAGTGDVDAIVTVIASGDSSSTTAPTPAAVVVMLDVSGSMAVPPTKIREARRAARAAIAGLRDGVLFAVIAGNDTARLVYPTVLGLATASEATRAEASERVGTLGAGGGTAMSTWLLATRRLLAPYEGVLRQAILLTDGVNESESRAALDAALAECDGVFQCDCRGVGTRWRVDELRAIASRLLGSIDIVAEPADMATDFESIVGRAMARRDVDVRLRLCVPPDARVRYVMQVAPTIDDLTGRGTRVDERCVDYPTGAWSAEQRDYHIGITVDPRAVGDELLAARVGVVVDGRVVTQTAMRAVWTDDPATSTVIHPRVAHYTGQEELAASIRRGLAARAAGDAPAATRELGRAVHLAATTGHGDTLQLLARVVDIDDAATGTVRLKRDVTAADEMTLDTRSTATVRVRPAT